MTCSEGRVFSSGDKGLLGSDNAPPSRFLRPRVQEFVHTSVDRNKRDAMPVSVVESNRAKMITVEQGSYACDATPPVPLGREPVGSNDVQCVLAEPHEDWLVASGTPDLTDT